MLAERQPDRANTPGGLNLRRSSDQVIPKNLGQMISNDARCCTTDASNAAHELTRTARRLKG